MIKLLLLLAKRFSFINRWFFEISKHYLPAIEDLKEIQADIKEESIKVPAKMSKQELLEHCQKDLDRVIAYAKYGELSGLEENKTYYQELK